MQTITKNNSNEKLAEYFGASARGSLNTNLGQDLLSRNSNASLELPSSRKNDENTHKDYYTQEDFFGPAKDFQATQARFIQLAQSKLNTQQ